jgi:hypothetical protein
MQAMAHRRSPRHHYTSLCKVTIKCGRRLVARGFLPGVGAYSKPCPSVSGGQVEASAYGEDTENRMNCRGKDGRFRLRRLPTAPPFDVSKHPTPDCQSRASSVWSAAHDGMTT